MVGAVHEHRVGVRHVEAGLDDHRRHQHVHLAVDEPAHHVLERALRHLPVPDVDARPRHQPLHVVGDGVDGLDAVVHEEHLPAPVQLARDALLDQRVVPGLHEREHGRAVARRRLHQREVAQAGQRQVQRARDRRGGQRQHVGLEPELLEALLVLHAEAMFLVDHDQAERLELHVLAEQPVRADDDVDRPVGEPGETCACSAAVRKRLSVATRTGKSASRSPNVRACCSARIVVGTSTATWRPGLHRLERGANRDLGLAVADVTDEQPIHGLRTLEVALHVVRRLALVRRVLEQERGFELLLPRRVGHVRRTGGEAAPRVQLQQLLRHLVDGGLRAIALLLPPASAELVQPRRRRVVADVHGGAIALDLVEPVERHVQPVTAFVFDHRDLDRALAHEDLLDAAVDPDAVLEMHDVVAGLERGDRLERDAGCRTDVCGGVAGRGGRSRGR